MTREELLANFDVNGPGQPGNLFGLPFTPEVSDLVIVPVPWEATVSYHSGTAEGPKEILKASRQVDFFMRDNPDAWLAGTAMLPIPHDIKKESNRLRVLIDQIHSRNDNDPELATVLSEKVNEGCENLNIYVKKTTQKYLEEGKIVGLLGGDHSTPLGFLRALSERHDRFGILQIDAHADLRKAYEGFTYSHGSVIFNALKISSVSKVVQVGIRDLCDEEYQMMKRGSGRIKTFFDDELANQLGQGHAWEVLCKDIVKELPEKVYISFDIDGLDPKLCPHTGTPVPGGLDFRQAVTLIKTVALSGKQIIGFDLNEVAVGDNTDWDANVGARILWNLCNWTLRNRK